MSTELNKKVADWVMGEGYSLEYRSASILRECGFEVRQGEYVRPSSDTNPREIDVTANITSKDRRSVIRITHIVECKYSRDKPWVILTAPNQIAPEACIGQTISTTAARAILGELSRDKDLHNYQLFLTPESPGFGGRQAFSKTNDVVYSTLQSIISAANETAKFYDEYNHHTLDPLRHIVICVPLIVIDADLFLASFSNEDGEMKITQTPHARLHWRGADSWNLHASIDIVTISHLGEFAKKRFSESVSTLEKMEKITVDVIESIKRRDLSQFKRYNENGRQLAMSHFLSRIESELLQQNIDNSLEAWTPWLKKYGWSQRP